MTPTEKGAFCEKCAFEVTDFTDKSPLEIKTILSEKMQAKERVCGHIENRQLIELNNEFIPWKSDQESFRAVWMFSLIAVFGMTLFSCQSTFSKEVVEKMKTSSEQLMEAEAKDTLDVALLNDSIIEMNDTILEYSGSDSLTLTNWEPWVTQEITVELDWIITGSTMCITTDGFVAVEPALPELKCVVDWLGDMTISGNFVPTEESERFSLENFRSVKGQIDGVTTGTEWIDQDARIHSQQLDAKRESGRPDFAAYISPNPVDASSKLFVTIPDEDELRLTLWEIPSQGKIHAETFDLVFGNHLIDINFTDLPIGKYACQLVWQEETIVLPFELLAQGN